MSTGNPLQRNNELDADDDVDELPPDNELQQRTRSTTTGKFSNSTRQSSATLSESNKMNRCWRVFVLFFRNFRLCCDMICRDETAEELMRIKADLLQREREGQIQEEERRREKVLRQMTKLQQALNAAEERAIIAEAGIAQAQNEIKAIYMEREKEMKEIEAEKEQEMKRNRDLKLLEVESRRLQELESLKEQLRDMENEKNRDAQLRTLSEIESIRSAQREARLGVVPVASTPAIDPHDRTYTLISTLQEEEKLEEFSLPENSMRTVSRFVPPPPRRVSKFG